MIEVDPQTAPLVQELFRLYATQRYSLKQLTELAYEWGIAYRKSGQPFTPGSFEKVLKILSTMGISAGTGSCIEGYTNLLSPENSLTPHKLPSIACISLKSRSTRLPMLGW
jgi:hypothetical protein